MPRSAKASQDAIARACAKLQVEGNLTIHTLREAVGGGGADYLARSLRAWRQQQREEARTPVENLISQGLQTALTEELQRAQGEAAEEVHNLYVEDKEHLDFCLAELKRLENEAEGLQRTLALERRKAEQTQQQAEGQARELIEQLQTQRNRADRMTERFEDLQRQQQGSQAELAVAREQRHVAETSLAQERAQHETTRAQMAAATRESATQNARVASLEERCAQQQEMLGYFRGDLKAKSAELETLRAAATTLQQELREAGKAAAAAESALREQRSSHKSSQAHHLQGLLARAADPKRRREKARNNQRRSVDPAEPTS